MSFKGKIAAVLLSAGMVTGVGVVSADSASAAGGVTPVCYYKSKVTSENFMHKTTVFNVVVSQQNIQYPAGLKRCHVVQTSQNYNKIFHETTRQVIWDGWIEVRY
jgi:hypothetical protein